MESATPYVITNVFVWRKDFLSGREALRMDEAVAGPPKVYSKQHPLRSVPKMEITTAIIHHTAMDLE